MQIQNNFKLHLTLIKSPPPWGGGSCNPPKSQHIDTLSTSSGILLRLLSFVALQCAGTQFVFYTLVQMHGPSTRPFFTHEHVGWCCLSILSTWGVSPSARLQQPNTMSSTKSLKQITLYCATMAHHPQKICKTYKRPQVSTFYLVRSMSIDRESCNHFWLLHYF